MTIFYECIQMIIIYRNPKRMILYHVMFDLRENVYNNIEHRMILYNNIEHRVIQMISGD